MKTKKVTAGKKVSSKKTSPTSSENVLQKLVVTGTAYTPNCAGCSGITATGIDVRSNPNQNIIATDPRVIPMGSKVRLTSKSFPSINGVYTAADTGGAIKGNRIDILVASNTRAKTIGVRHDIVIEVLRSGY